ncbi:Arabinogalactan peptide 12 [Hibiscus syriacus]|uniref:Arabinogalactan peptide 12 n=1 Tax=Hibiscus syriacus TaxID=106335 RepID=A0A6A3AKQ1_HIBSY|nr:Arabinogalactan peptide 12 [Hibiscus syriacus]
MEALRTRLFFAMVVVLMAVSAIQNVAAADAPAPSPTSDATAFVPTVVASLVALAFGLLL